jgi:hypothetical protein
MDTNPCEDTVNPIYKVPGVPLLFSLFSEFNLACMRGVRRSNVNKTFANYEENTDRPTLTRGILRLGVKTDAMTYRSPALALTFSVTAIFCAAGTELVDGQERQALRVGVQLP